MILIRHSGRLVLALPLALWHCGTVLLMITGHSMARMTVSRNMIAASSLTVCQF